MKKRTILPVQISKLVAEEFVNNCKEGDYVVINLDGQQHEMVVETHPNLVYLTTVDSHVKEYNQPSILTQVNIDSNVREYEDISASAFATDIDGDNLTYYYEWFVNNVSVESGEIINQLQNVTSDTFSLAASNYTDGDEVLVQVIANDGKLNTTPLNSSPTIISAYATFSFSPTLTNVEKNEVSFVWTTNATSVELYQDGVFIVNTSDFYTFVGLVGNTTYEFSFRPYDVNNIRGEDIFYNATTLISNNVAPTITSSRIDATSVYTTTDLEGFCEADDDNVNIYFDYVWYVDGLEILSDTSDMTLRNVEKSIGSFDNGNFSYNQNVTLGCVVYDGELYSQQLNSSIVVLNTLPVVDEYLINDTGVDYIAAYDYFDIDGHIEEVLLYDWYRNGTALNLNVSSLNINTYFDAGDNVISQVTTGDGLTSATYNSSLFYVGDLEAPVLWDLIVPEQTYTDNAYILEAKCTDDVGVAAGYPKVKWTNPNLIQEEVSMFYDTADNYIRQYTFPVAGEYTNIMFECKDGNSNTIIDYNGTILSQVRQTVVNVEGGSAVTVDEIIEILNITDGIKFKLTPSLDYVTMGAGDLEIVEFEIENLDVIDLDFTTQILVDAKSPETQSWMSFETGITELDFVLTSDGGLGSNKRFIRFFIEVPDGVEVGSYQGTIEFNTAGQTEQYVVDIEIVDGSKNLWDILTTELFTINLGITGDVTGDGSSTEGTPVTPIGVLVLLSGIGFLGWLVWKYGR